MDKGKGSGGKKKNMTFACPYKTNIQVQTWKPEKRSLNVQKKLQHLDTALFLLTSHYKFTETLFKMQKHPLLLACIPTAYRNKK